MWHGSIQLPIMWLLKKEQCQSDGMIVGKVFVWELL